MSQAEHDNDHVEVRRERDFLRQRVIELTKEVDDLREELYPEDTGCQWFPRLKRPNRHSLNHGSVLLEGK